MGAIDIEHSSAKIVFKVCGSVCRKDGPGEQIFLVRNNLPAEHREIQGRDCFPISQPFDVCIMKDKYGIVSKPSCLSRKYTAEEIRDAIVCYLELN